MSVDRWGDTKADRDALDDWITREDEPSGGDEIDFGPLELDDTWSIGDDDGPGGVEAIILGTLRLGGVPFHVQGYQVEVRNGLQSALQRQDQFDAIYGAIEGDREAWQTVEINQKPYVLIITPYLA